MTTLFALSLTMADAQAVAEQAFPILLVLVFVILAGPLLVHIIGHAARLIWRLLRIFARAALRYAIDKAIEAIFWGAVAIIGALLFWG